MSTSVDRLLEWLHRIYTTQLEEIDCDTLHDALARFVDLEISGQDAARLLPLVRQHLDQCPNCDEIYEVLLAVTQLEAQGHLMDVPPPWEQPDWPGATGQWYS